MKTHRGRQTHEKKKNPQNRLPAFHRRPSPLWKLRHLEQAAGDCLLFTHLSESVGLLRKVCTQHAHTHTCAHTLPPNQTTQSYTHTHICGESPPAAATATVVSWFEMMMILDPSSSGKEDDLNRRSCVCAAAKPRPSLHFLINP